MEMIIGGITSLLGGGGAAAAGTAGTVGAVSSGFSLATVLQGTASVLGVVSALGAGAADAAQAEMAAADADAEQRLDNLQGIERRGSIKRAMADALGAQDVAYAASGVDLSFGTARQARTDAYREGDMALTADASTQTTRTARLSERAANYRASAKNARRLGVLNALAGGANTLLSFQQRG